MLLGDLWQDNSDAVAAICHEYEVKPSTLEPYEILVAGYWSGEYSGKSWILLREKTSGQPYEVCGSHCSCYGLEEQFDPKLTSAAYLRSDMFPKPDDCPNEDWAAIQKVIASL